LISASGAFGELQDSLNTIWSAPKQNHPFLTMVKNRLFSLSMVFVLGFFMVVSLLISALVTGLSAWWVTTSTKVEMEVINSLVSVMIIAGLFSCIFRYLPDVPVTWHDVVPGSIFSAILFVAGKLLLGWYIAHSAFASSYGAAASFIVILFWVFYSAQILYFGAECTRAYCHKYGSRAFEGGGRE
jgi:membrane protein